MPGTPDSCSITPIRLRAFRSFGSMPKRRTVPDVGLRVPSSEVDHWIALEPSLLCHLAETAQAIGRAQMAGFKPERIGVMLAGLQVPHCHFHVVPIRGLHDLDFGNQDPDPDAKMMDEAAGTIRRELRKLRYTQVSD